MIQSFTWLLFTLYDPSVLKKTFCKIGAQIAEMIFKALSNNLYLSA